MEAKRQDNKGDSNHEIKKKKNTFFSKQQHLYGDGSDENLVANEGAEAPIK